MACGKQHIHPELKSMMHVANDVNLPNMILQDNALQVQPATVFKIFECSIFPELLASQTTDASNIAGKHYSDDML